MTRHTISIPGLSPKANDILLWRDPKKSAVCVVGSTATWAILTFSGLTPLVLCARLLTVVFFATWFWHAAAKVLGRTGPGELVPPVLRQGLHEEEITKLVHTARPVINEALGVVGTLLSGTNPSLTFKTVGVLFSIGWVFGNMPLLTLAYVLVILVFSLPKAYEFKKDDADKLIDIALTKAKEVHAKLDDVVFKKIHKKVKTT